MLLEMKTHLLPALPLALLLCLGCAGISVSSSDLESAANRALGAALGRVNAVYAAGRLYRATRGSVTKVVPAGRDSVDLLMKFGIKETECAQSSGRDPQTCALRPGFFVPSASCSARVRLSAASAQVVSLRCGGDSSSSSSSESSEEVRVQTPQKFPRRRNQLLVPSASGDLTPTPEARTERPPPLRADAPLRGDTFSNYLE